MTEVDRLKFPCPMLHNLEQRGIKPLVAMRGAGWPADPESKAGGRQRQWRAPRLRAMERRMQQPGARAKSACQKCTVEPMFGTMKAHMGLRWFHLRGHDKVETEWTLTALAYKAKRLHKMGAGVLLQAG